MQKFYTRSEVDAIIGRKTFTKGTFALIAFAIICWGAVGYLIYHPATY